MTLASLLIGLLSGSLLAGAAVSKYYTDKICSIKYDYDLKVSNLQTEI